jgi:hypothetical protein
MIEIDKERMAKHASLAAIDHYIRDAQRSRRQAAAQAEWLVNLRREREQQIADGTWPAAPAEERALDLMAALRDELDDALGDVRRRRAAVDALPATPCCDSHNQHCEPPSELCCERCTEATHGCPSCGVWLQNGQAEHDRVVHGEGIAA